ncbi:MAG TPA: C1 family peptidase [Lacunisphaera sp.]|nr:C1 family peptidase [Lacunisphaera sp.]
MSVPSRVAVLLFWLWLGVGHVPAQTETSALVPGSKLESLTVGPTTYRQVQVRSINARTLVIIHAGGMASIRLRDLSPEWQARFHYDPVLEAATDEEARTKPAPMPSKHTARPAAPADLSGLERLLQQFGTPAAVQAEVNLRPKFSELELRVKNQGRRPSCAIFAVVSALEFQNAILSGHAEKFSEEYLIWAVRRIVQRTPLPAGPAEATPDDADEGFSLNEVVSALRAYGIPLQTSMPYHYGENPGALEPPPEIIKEARSHQRVAVVNLPGRDAATRLNNLVQALNAGFPVTVGMAWPNYRTLRSAYLSAQKPMAGAGHAVTVVGYQSGTGRIEDAVFIFKNSWGVNWGQGGYGMVTYGYLSHYLAEAVLLEVQRG